MSDDILDSPSPTPVTDTEARDRSHKIQSLREMINNAESTIQSAKAMLLQLEGKKKVGRKRKVEEIEDGSVIEGAFDGQIMVGNDGKRYPVPANYASKSKLVQGDILKLTITPDGSFIYKQIGPAVRRHAIGIVSQDEGGNYIIVADGHAYRVLLASITYFKAEPGDEVALVLPRDIEATWCAIENIIQKGSALHHTAPVVVAPAPRPAPVDMEHWKKEVLDTPTLDEPVADTPPPAPVVPESVTPSSTPADTEADRLRQAIIDEWIKDTETATAATPSDKA